MNDMLRKIDNILTIVAEYCALSGNNLHISADAKETLSVMIEDIYEKMVCLLDEH